MSKYIPAVKVVDNHFKYTSYEMAWRNEACETYQDALTEATEQANIKTRERDPVVRPDGVEFPVPKYLPVVLKEVNMVEAS